MPDHFACTVRGQGPGVLLAHGGGGSVAANFGPLLDGLSDEYTMVGVDYPGTGGRPRSPRPLVLDEIADELVNAAIGAGLEKFTVVGYSLGTTVAVRVATRHPDRVRGLVLTAGFARLDNRTRLITDVWRALLAGDRRVLATFLTLQATGAGSLNSWTPAELESAITDLADFIPPGSDEHVALVQSADITGELAAIDVPTLVVVTTADDVARPELARRLADGIPGARTVEIDAGHGIVQEAPGQWLRAVAAFLPTPATR